MEYYDHKTKWEKSHERTESSNEMFANQYESYRAFYELNGIDCVKKYRDYRKSYRGRGNYCNNGDGRQRYYPEDRDLRNLLNEENGMVFRKTQDYSLNENFSDPKSSKVCESDSSSGSEYTDSCNISENDVNLKQETNRRANKKGNDRKSGEELSDEMDIEKEMHPISYYLESDDREEMLIQVFKVINGAKLTAMLPPILKNMDIAEVKLLCLEQLEGMSKKRIRAVFEGEEMEDSSDTDEDSEKVAADIPDKRLVDMNICKTDPCYDKNHHKGQTSSKAESDKNESTESKAKNYPVIKKADKNRKKVADSQILGNVTGSIQFKSSGAPADKFRVKPCQLHVSSESSEEDLKTVIDTRNKERKRKNRTAENIQSKAVGFKSRKRSKTTCNDDVKRRGFRNESSEEIQPEKNKSGKTLMELLELEMRARAIKALLNKNDNRIENREETNQTSALKTDFLKNNQVDEIDKDEMKQWMEKDKQLQKAREQLHISESKKREEEEILERKHEKIRNRLEEQKRMKEAEELEAMKKEQLEAERRIKALKKKEEHQNFLIWKEERQRKKEEKNLLKLKRQKEDDSNNRIAVREKIRKMLESDKNAEVDSANEENGCTKFTKDDRKIQKTDTEGEEDDLNRKFDITFTQCDVSLEEGEIDSEEPSNIKNFHSTVLARETNNAKTEMFKSSEIKQVKLEHISIHEYKVAGINTQSEKDLPIQNKISTFDFIFNLVVELLPGGSMLDFIFNLVVELLPGNARIQSLKTHKGKEENIKISYPVEIKGENKLVNIEKEEAETDRRIDIQIEGALRHRDEGNYVSPSSSMKEDVDIKHWDGELLSNKKFDNENKLKNIRNCCTSAALPIEYTITANTSTNNVKLSEEDEVKLDTQKNIMIQNGRNEIQSKNRCRKSAIDDRPIDSDEGERESKSESFEAMVQTKDPKKRMIMHHLQRKPRKEISSPSKCISIVTATDITTQEARPATSHEFKIMSKKQDLEGTSTNLPYVSKKMAQHMKRIKRMQAFEVQSNMQNMFLNVDYAHPPLPEPLEVQNKGDKPVEKEKQRLCIANENQKLATDLHSEKHDGIGSTINDEFNNCQLESTVVMNAASKEKVNLANTDIKSKNIESTDEEEEVQGENDHLWNAIMGPKI